MHHFGGKNSQFIDNTYLYDQHHVSRLIKALKFSIPSIFCEM